MTNPYDDEEYAKIYNGRYLDENSSWPEDTKIELQLIEDCIGKTWCDFACGTGFHLSNIKRNLIKTGIDRSAVMMSQTDNLDIEFLNLDILKWKPKNKYDLVTNFWLGHTHQKSLDEVLQFLQKMIFATNTGGTLMLSAFVGDKNFFTESYKQKVVVGDEFKFESIQWSYSEHDMPEHTYTCICPHPELILETITPHFENHKIFNRENSKYGCGMNEDGSTKYYGGAGKEMMIFENKL